MARRLYVLVGYDEPAGEVDGVALPRDEDDFAHELRDSVEGYHPLYVVLFAQTLKSYLEPLVLSQALFERR